MEETDAVAAELGTLQARSLGLRGTGLARLGFLDQWANDVRLPALVEMLAQTGVRSRALLLGHPSRDDRLAVGGRLRDLGHSEVAVDRERERARDRRRGHVQDVWTSSFGECAPLLDAEPMLFVDDGDGEVPQFHALLDQRMRTDDDVGGLRVRAFTLRRCARQQCARDTELATDLLDRQKVLLCERLGRGHQRALSTGLDGPQDRVESDDCLPRADVTLEEALHRYRSP